MKAYKNWVSRDQTQRNNVQEIDNHLETTKASESVNLISEDIHLQEELHKINIDERLPGLEHLSAEQLFFLNFAQVLNYDNFKMITLERFY